jgi:putative membrane protein
MTNIFNARSNRDALSRTRARSYTGVTFSLVALLGLSLLPACSDDDDDIVDRPAATNGPNGSNGSNTDGTSPGNTTSPGGGTMGPSNTTTTSGTGSAGAGTAAGGSTAATGTTGAGTPAGSGVVTAGTGGAGGAAGGTAGAAGTAGTSAGTAGAATAADAGAGADAGGALAVAVQELNDGQLLFIADTINAGEVDQARAALPRLEAEAARAYAQDMIEEHEPARDALLQLAEAEDVTPELSPVATDLREQSEQVLIQLLSTPGENVDALYIDSQVTMHAQAFQLLEGMIAAADAEPVETLLTQLRASVGGHLDTARQLQDTLAD